MNYQKFYYDLKDNYSWSEQKVSFPGKGFTIYNLPFRSRDYDFLPTADECPVTEGDQYHLTSDDQIQENRRFVYPVLVGNQKRQPGKAIILLHGLNERNWDKYLPWAYALFRRTGQPVILFPISFHVNRCPDDWKNPRLMSRLARQRKEKNREITESSFLNAAISERIQALPKRFYTSGLETYFDLVDLIQQLTSGNHPLLGKMKQINFFGYSIGALLTEILLMANPQNMLNDSKAFLFCGGATVDKMKGVSKYILDNAAFQSLRSFYLHLDEQLNRDLKLRDILKKLDPGIYFRAMVDSLGLKDIRVKRLNELSGRLKVVALKQDLVIPPDAIRETFEGIGRRLNRVFKILDFPYEYSHEIVFPANDIRNQKAIDQSFQKVFRTASSHLG